MERILTYFGVERAGELVQIFQASLHVILVLLLAWVVLWLSRRAIRIFKAYMIRQTDNPEELKRVETLGRVFRYIASVGISIVAGMLVLSELGISIAPILATAGVVGIAVGFGAQSLVKDYFTGFFLLLENQVRQGDVVEAGGKAGLVEEMTLRYIRMRDYDGNVHFIPNGIVTTVTNMSREFAFAVIDVGVAYREDLDEVMETMGRVAAGLRADELYGPKILGEFEMAGVEKWDDSAVMIRCRFKVLPLEQWGVRREFLRRLKQAFDAKGIEIPFPHLTLYPGQAKDGSVPPLHLAIRGQPTAEDMAGA